MALSDKGIDTMNMQTDKKARIEKTNPATAAEETIGIGRAKGELPIAANPIVEPHRWHCTYSLGEEIGNRGMKKIGTSVVPRCEYIFGLNGIYRTELVLEEQLFACCSSL